MTAGDHTRVVLDLVRSGEPIRWRDIAALLERHGN